MKNIKYILIATIIFLFMGCNKKDEIIPLSGNHVGFVDLIDNYGNEINEKANVKVTVENTSYSAITNKDGRFEIKDLPAGTYNLRFSKEGFGTKRFFSIQFVGGNVPSLLGRVSVFELPNVQVLSVDINQDSNGLSFNITTSPINEYKSQVFLGRTPDVNYNEYDYRSSTWTYCCTELTVFTHEIWKNGLPFFPGEKVYAAIYLINPHEEWSFYEPDNDVYVFSSYKQVEGEFDFVYY